MARYGRILRGALNLFWTTKEHRVREHNLLNALYGTVKLANAMVEQPVMPAFTSGRATSPVFKRNGSNWPDNRVVFQLSQYRRYLCVGPCGPRSRVLLHQRLQC